MTKRLYIAVVAGLLAFTTTLSILSISDNQKLRRENRDLMESLMEATAREAAHICPETGETAGAVVETTPVAVEIPDGMTWLQDVTVTHYDACVVCCGSTAGIGASGRKVVPNYSVAVDPSVIPLGSDVVIQFENGETLMCRADDTGGAVKGNKIDLCVATHEEALAAGVRKATVGFRPMVQEK